MLNPRTSLANYRRSWRSSCRHLHKPEPLTVSEWAERYRYLSSEASSKRGKWTSLPMQVEPMDAVLDASIESVCLMWAGQAGGKTELLLNIQAYHIDHDPAPQLVLQPTVEMGETYSKDRLAPMLRDSPRLRGKVSEPRVRDSGNTILHKRFAGGHLTIVGANAPAPLASRPIRVLLCDEVDRYPESAGTEGDPISLAVKRTDTFRDSIILMTSTPTVRGASRIEAEYNLTDKRIWFVPCHHCGVWQQLFWAQVKWDEDKPQTAHYECEHCGGHWNDEERCANIRRGEWRATAPFHGKRGYHLNGIYSLFKARKGFISRMHQMAEEFLEADRLGERTLQVWVNTFKAETWERKATSLEPGPIRQRAEDYGPKLPEGVLVLVCGVDVQADRIEAEVIGYGHGDESWGVRTHILYGDPELQRTWTEFDSWLLSDYEHAKGARLRIACCCIDSGFKPKSVYAFSRDRIHRRVFAVRGSTVAGEPLVNRPRRSSVRETLLFMIGVDTAKEIIYSRLRISAVGPRYCHFPKGFGYDQEFYDQLTGEKCETDWINGKLKRTWAKKRERNEALDRRVYALAALEILNPDYVALSKGIDILSISDKAPHSATQNARAGQGLRPKGWIGSWRR